MYLNDDEHKCWIDIGCIKCKCDFLKVIKIKFAHWGKHMEKNIIISICLKIISHAHLGQLRKHVF